MSNINPNPRFVPTPGTPTAAKTRGGFVMVPFDHRTMAEVMRDECLSGLPYRMAMSRVCPNCNAAPGVRCRMPCGAPYEGLHTARRAA